MNFQDAVVYCDKDKSIYFPTHQYQHYIFAIGMKEKASMNSIWIGMKKINGSWYEINGREVKPHMLNWYKDEPSTTDECVIADSNIE